MNILNYNKEGLVHAVETWIRYYTYVRYQRRFGVRTPYEVRSEALGKEVCAKYPIPYNAGVAKYKTEHYASA